MDIFQKQGIHYQYENELPLTVKGHLRPDRFEIPGNISSQFITGLLFALPLLEGDSEIVIKGSLESKPYIDLTIDVLKQFSIQIENKVHEVFHIMIPKLSAGILSSRGRLFSGSILDRCRTFRGRDFM